MHAFRGFDFMPVFAIAIVAFIAIATLQFSHSWGDAAHGLYLFEKACPLSNSPTNHPQ
jgi:hypothetical protein